MSENVFDFNKYPAPLAPKAETQRYHVGIYKDNPPAWDITLAGISFPVMNFEWDEHNNQRRFEGAFVELTKEECKAIKEAIETRIVRWLKDKKTGKTIRAEVWDVGVTGFRPDPNDEPLWKYIYFKKAPAEAVKPVLKENALAELQKAIEEAAKSEAEHRQDPVDKIIREVHGAAKKAGQKLEKS